MIDKLKFIDQDFASQIKKIYSKDQEKVNKFLLLRTKAIDQSLEKMVKSLGLDRYYIFLAIGGYGRKEVFPNSDIDLSIIDVSKKSKTKSELLSKFITWCWDQDIKVSHSVRTFGDIKRLCKDDLKEYTSYLSLRIIFKQNQFQEKFDYQIKKIEKLYSPKKFFKSKYQEQIIRHSKFNLTEFNLEPDLKESPGCIRDMHVIIWMLGVCFNNFNFDRINIPAINTNEWKNTLTDYNKIKVLRYFLNYKYGTNRISFDYQISIARKLGHQNRKSLSSVELFMKDFYGIASRISDFNELFIQYCHENFKNNKKSKSIKTKNLFLKDILDIFHKIGNRNKEFYIDLNTLSSIKSSIRKIKDQEFLGSDIQKSFIKLLTSKYNLSSILKKLKQLGILKKLIPEFGEIEGQIQFDRFHSYSVDEHTFKVVRNMRQMFINKVDQTLKVECELIRRLPKIEILYLAGIFHDLGKGKGGDHSKIGIKIFKKFALRSKMNKSDSFLISWLIENHLFMSSVAQRMDVYDLKTVKNFTKTVDTVEKLDYLYLLTINDIRGTNEELWNSWKHNLLKQLYLSSRKILNKEIRIGDKSNINEKKNKLNTIFSVQNKKTKDILMQMPDIYFQKTSLRSLEKHFHLLKTLNASGVSILVEKNKDYLKLNLISKNMSGLFLRICNILNTLLLEVVDANINTSKDGKIAINTFLIKHRKLGNKLNNDDLKKITNRIKKAFNEEKLDILKIGKVSNPFSFKTHVEIHNDLQSNKTVVTIEALDTANLLSRIAKIFYENKIDVDSARITTLGERVEDNFYVFDRKTESNVSENKCARLQKVLLRL